MFCILKYFFFIFALEFQSELRNSFAKIKKII